VSAPKRKAKLIFFRKAWSTESAQRRRRRAAKSSAVAAVTEHNAQFAQILSTGLSIGRRLAAKPAEGIAEPSVELLEAMWTYLGVASRSNLSVIGTVTVMFRAVAASAAAEQFF
jgi:hypothetical protein